MEMSDVQPTKQYFNLGADGGCNGGWLGGNGGFSGMLAILLLFFLFGSGNFGGFGGYGRGVGPLGADMSVTATQAIAENKAALNNINANIMAQAPKLDAVVQGITNSTAALQNSLTNGLYAINTSVQNTKFDISQAIDHCCCLTNSNIASVNANLDKLSCAIISAGKDNTQAVLNALCNHWQDQSNRQICKLEAELNATKIINELKK